MINNTIDIKGLKFEPFISEDTIRQKVKAVA
jgi:hypothetical protein